MRITEDDGTPIEAHEISGWKLHAFILAAILIPIVLSGWITLF